MKYKYYLLASHSNILRDFSYEHKVSMMEVCWLSRDAERFQTSLRGLTGVKIYIHRDYLNNLESSMAAALRRIIAMLLDYGTIGEIVWFGEGS